MTSHRPTSSRLDPRLFSLDWLDSRSWLKPMEHYLEVIRASPDELQRRRPRFLAFMSGLKEYVYPWQNITASVPIQSIFERLKLRTYPLGDDVSGDAQISWDHLNAAISAEARNGPRGTQITLIHELCHGVAPYGRQLEIDRELDDRRPAAETLANRFAHDITWPLPALSVLSAEGKVENGWSIWFDNLFDLMRVTSRSVFLFQYETSGNDRSDAGDRDGPVTQIIVGAPDHFGETLDDLKKTALGREGDGKSAARWRPPPVGSSMLTREGLFYTFDGTAISDWLVQNRLVFRVEIPHRPGVVAHTTEFTQEFVTEDGCLIPKGKYFLRYLPVGESTFRVLAVADEDGSLARAWTMASRRRQSGPLLPWGDSTRYSQPELYEEWVNSLEAQYLR